MALKKLTKVIVNGKPLLVNDEMLKNLPKEEKKEKAPEPIKEEKKEKAPEPVKKLKKSDKKDK